MSLPLKKGSSLVDLYHINRDLLKKPTFKNQKKRHNSCVAPKCSTKLENPGTCSKKTAKWGKGNFFVGFLKILIVIVVALMTKRMVLGATVSALCLFFLEYVVTFLYRLFRRLFSSRTKKTSVNFTRIEWDHSEGGAVSGCSSLTVSSEEMHDLPDDSDSDICFSDFANLDRNKILEFEDIGSGKGILESDQDCNCEGLNSRRRGSRREKVKSKMKKLVPKRIRKSIKKRPGFKREGTDLVEDGNCEAKEYDTELDA